MHGAKQIYILEVLGSLKLRYFVQTRLSRVQMVGHRQLSQTVAVLETLQYPDACSNYRRRIDLVADVRGRKRHQSMKLILEVQQPWKSCPDDDSPQTVPNEGYSL